jgi:hypothetical protein
MKEVVDKKGIAQFLGGHGSIADSVRHLQYSHWAHTLFLASIAGVIARAALEPRPISNNDTMPFAAAERTLE